MVKTWPLAPAEPPNAVSSVNPVASTRAILAWLGDALFTLVNDPANTMEPEGSATMELRRFPLVTMFTLNEPSSVPSVFRRVRTLVPVVVASAPPLNVFCRATSTLPSACTARAVTAALGGVSCSRQVRSSAPEGFSRKSPGTRFPFTAVKSPPT